MIPKNFFRFPGVYWIDLETKAGEASYVQKKNS